LASIIFIISITGVFVTLTAMRRPVVDKESALAAAVFGKQVLEALRSSVNAGTFYSTTCSSPCSNFDLSLGTHQVPHNNLPFSWPSSTLAASNKACDVPNGCLVYTVTCAAGLSTGSGSPLDCISSGSNDIARRVDLSINWPNAL
jgi:hypothetical protein